MVKNLILLGFLGTLLFSMPLGAKEKSRLAEYYQSINYSCSQASDCTIKDVGNCCGAFPKCVNKDAMVNRDLVRDACKKEKRMGVCGFPSLVSCKCVEKKCVGAGS